MSGVISAAQATRLRARLLEFLKFRVLASQEDFFAAWRPAGVTPPQGSSEAGSAAAHLQTTAVAGALADLDLSGFRRWLQPLWPAASSLRDDDLRACLEQAHALYVDPPCGGRR
jgi:hypothetical protein